MKQSDLKVTKNRIVKFFGNSYQLFVENKHQTEYVWLLHMKNYTGGARGNYGDSTIAIYELGPGKNLNLVLEEGEFLIAQSEQGVSFQKI